MGKASVKLSDFDRVYPDSKKQELSPLILSWYVHRVVSKPLAWLALRMGISANMLTVASMLSVAAGSVLIALGGVRFTVVGVVLIWLWAILDGADGHVARINGPTTIGEFLDRMAADFRRAFLYPCLGIRVFVENDSFMQFLTQKGVPAEMLLVMGFATSVLILWAVSTNMKFRLVFGSESEKSAIGRPRTERLSIQRLAFIIGGNMYEFEIVFLVVAAIAGMWTALLLYSLLLSLLALSVSLLQLLTTAIRMKKE